MRSARSFCFAFVAVAATLLVACGGHGAALPPAPVAAGAVRPPAGPARILGRRAANAPVEAVIALRLPNQRALDRFVDRVSNPSSAMFRHFLTPAEFASRFAPTPQQQQRAIDVLHRAGFTIERTFSNRLLIVVSAPSAAVERLFSTRVADFDQGAYGTRFANVTPVHIPPSLAGLVSAVDLDSRVHAHAASQADALPQPDGASGTNVILNGSFKQKMTDWQACGPSAPSISKSHPYNPPYDALTGSASDSAGEVSGWSAICQRVTIPQSATLVAYLWDATNATSTKSSFQAVGLMDKPGHVVAMLQRTLDDKKHWVRYTADLSKYAGRHTYLFFGVYGKGQKATFDTQYVDAVSLKGIVPTPTPSPTGSPTTTPSPSPTPSPTPTPTATPTPTPPAGPVTPGPDTPLSGPALGPSNGWAPRGVADGFDFPVQNGYAGSGEVIGIVIDQRAFDSDIASFYSYNQISSHGILTYHPIGEATTLPNDPTEATLDIEAVAGLAPMANIIVYLTHDLSNSSILTAYNQALSDGKVSVLDSSFGECESEDASFASTSDSLAASGAAMGMTFVAASGDIGRACFNGLQNVVGVNAPASGPHFVAVGGSQSFANGPVKSPVVWNYASGYLVGTSGGGVSTAWDIPSYQVGLRGSPVSTKKRNVPDISLPALNDDIFIHGTDELFAGTSWSSSIATALFATTEQFCGPLGWVNPAIYGEYAARGKDQPWFIDVTSGNNQFAGFAGNDAVAGYDNASGIGMPAGIKFAAKLCGRSTTLFRRHR